MVDVILRKRHDAVLVLRILPYERLERGLFCGVHQGQPWVVVQERQLIRQRREIVVHGLAHVESCGVGGAEAAVVVRPRDG